MYRQLVNTQMPDLREKMIDMLALQLEVKRISQARGVAYSTGFTPDEIANLCGIPADLTAQAVSLIERDQNVRIIDGRISVPDTGELIKQARFYRKQNTRRSQQN